MTANENYQRGDPVVDLAQGRPMIVLDAPDQTVADWSSANDYDLTDNYANGKLGATDAEPVVRCVYVSDIRSEPSKDYTFPVSRVALIDAHHADGGRRIAERVTQDVLEAVFIAMHSHPPIDSDDIDAVVSALDYDADLVDEARELADVELWK